jgi:hypothetical protein
MAAEASHELGAGTRSQMPQNAFLTPALPRNSRKDKADRPLPDGSPKRLIQNEESPAVSSGAF